MLGRQLHLDKEGCVLLQEACQINLQLLWIESLYSILSV